VDLLFENFEENRGILASWINPEDNSKNLIYRFAEIISSPSTLVA
jgi:hypothetical protein